MSGSTSVRSEVGFAVVLARGDDGVNLVVGDVRALEADRLVRARRQKQAVAHPDQLLGALLIQDHAAVGE